MKKLLLFSLMLGVSLYGYSQVKLAKMKPGFDKISAKYQQANDVIVNQAPEATPAGPKAISETQIGHSFYDTQSNGTMGSRIYRHSDGTIAATWTLGIVSSAYADRGTGYNYFDGTAWDSIPETRIESIRTGWPTYQPLGAGEVVFAHTGAGLNMMKRDTKGTGAWTSSSVPNPAGTSLIWPSACVNGNTIHVLACSGSGTGTGSPYQGQLMALVYMRSTDGGATWTDTIIPGLDTASGWFSTSADRYKWAPTQNGTIAFVTTHAWGDMLLFKSTDDGLTWTKSVIFDHPMDFPMFQDTPYAPVDTVYSSDGSMDVAFDSYGKAHVVFGLQRYLYDDTSATDWSYFPGYGYYIGYWNEDMPIITSMDSDSLIASGNLMVSGTNLVGMLDLDGSGMLLDNMTATDGSEIGKYGVGLASYPQLCISNDIIYLGYSAVNELEYGGSISYSQFFRNIYMVVSEDLGATWNDSIYILTDPQTMPLYEGMECTWPALAKNADGSLHMIFHRDDEPGTSIGTDADNPTDNACIYLNIPKSDVGVGIQTVIMGGNVNLYPNPAKESANLSIVSEKAQKATVTVTNILGQQAENSYNLNAGNNTINLNLSDLSAGLYLVNVKYGKNVFSTKLVVE